jgi:1,5-anhydro-D-fructose reductase (1,5-anhydro-D-mannitol-forming)
MGEVLRWGVIGIGNIVQGTMAPAIVAEPQMELVAGVSRDRGRADAFAEKFGARFAYTDYDEMLANPQIDAVFVATPNAQHAEQVLKAARAGKHVLCDKPMALTVADAEAEVAACRAAGVKLGINFHNRHLPWVRDVRQLLQDGVIGEVHTIHVMVSAGVVPPISWRNDAELAGLGTVYSQGVHVLDFLRFQLGSEPSEVVAMFDDEKGKYQVETEALVLMRFDNGTRVFLDIDCSNRFPQNDISYYGEKGRIVGRNLTRSRKDGELLVTTESGETSTAYPSPGAHRRCIAAFTAAVLAGEEPNASGEDGVRSMQTTEAIATSSRERRVVPVAAR